MAGQFYCVFIILLSALIKYSFGTTDWKYFEKHYYDIPVPSPRIIGGYESTPHLFPYTAGIVVNGISFCGGALISRNYVLTAGHCASEIRHSVEVILGAHNITANETAQFHTLVEKIIIHEDFNSSNFQNDLALLKLKTPAPLSEAIQIALLPNQTKAGETYENRILTALGWGLTQDMATATLTDISKVLMVVDVQVLTNKECGHYYNNMDKSQYFVTWKNLCTTGYKNRGTCKGDSGGPLVLKNMLVGIVSIGTTLCEICSPSIYTKVGEFLDWIERNTDVRITE